MATSLWQQEAAEGYGWWAQHGDGVTPQKTLPALIRGHTACALGVREPRFGVEMHLTKELGHNLKHQMNIRRPKGIQVSVG